jgi:hypothetical protein
MRQFYFAYHGHPKLQPLVGEISWAKHLPKELNGQLPGPEEIARLLEDEG